MSDREEPKCAQCGRIETALGGDVHCIGDCDDAFHDDPNGCHRFLPPVVPAPSLEKVAEEVTGEVLHVYGAAPNVWPYHAAVEKVLAILQRHFGDKEKS